MCIYLYIYTPICIHTLSGIPVATNLTSYEDAWPFPVIPRLTFDANRKQRATRPVINNTRIIRVPSCRKIAGFYVEEFWDRLAFTSSEAYECLDYFDAASINGKPISPSDYPHYSDRSFVQKYPYSDCVIKSATVSLPLDAKLISRRNWCKVQRTPPICSSVSYLSIEITGADFIFRDGIEETG